MEIELRPMIAKYAGPDGEVLSRRVDNDIVLIDGMQVGYLSLTMDRIAITENISDSELAALDEFMSEQREGWNPDPPLYVPAFLRKGNQNVK